MIRSVSQTLYRLDNLNKEHQRISYQQSTGKKLQYGSDDANTFTREVFIKDKIKVYEGIKIQIQKTTAQNTASDSSIDEAKKLLDLIKTELIKGINDTTDDSARKAIATKLEGIKENLLKLANEQLEGEYLFPGSDSSIKPFTQDEESGKVFYNGDTNLRKIIVEDGSYRDRGITGVEAFFSSQQKASVGETINFAVDDLIFDNDGNKWQRHKFVEPGETLRISTEPIIDAKGVEWTLNDSIPQLEDSSGNTIPATAVGGGFFDITVPSSTEGLAYNQLRKYDESGELVPNEAIDIFGTYPNELKVAVPNNPGHLEVKKSIFNILDTAINALEKKDVNGASIDSKEAKTILKDSLSKANSAYDEMNLAHSKLGSRNKIFDISLERVSTKIFQYQRLDTDVSSVDIAKVAVEAKSLELTYTSLYATISRTNELALVNFLR